MSGPTYDLSPRKAKEYRYSEIFSSIQGEGFYTGVPTIWLRFWGCNLDCKGFGQKDLDDPASWDLPYLDFDPKDILAVEDLPVWDKGCDSSYSWSKHYRHLAKLGTVEQIVEELYRVNSNGHNPSGYFQHPKSGQETHLAFTGGEPMMSQAAMLSILKMMKEKENQPRFITVETNGTRLISDELEDFLQGDFTLTSDYDGWLDDERGSPEWFWSVSPKLRSSGEKWEDAIKPEVVAGYAQYAEKGQLKFVVNDDTRTWYEVEQAVQAFREVGVEWPIWIMPVGATKEAQEAEDTQRVVEEAIARGYNVSGRLHCHIWGNKIGT